MQAAALTVRLQADISDLQKKLAEMERTVQGAMTGISTAATKGSTGLQAIGAGAQAASTGMHPLITALRDQITTIGRSESDLIRYRAAQAGVAAEAAPLVLQLQNIKAAMAAKAAEEAAAAQASRDQAAAVRAQAQAQQAFLSSLRERADTAGLDPAGLLRYRAAQLGVEKQADTLIAKLHAQGAAGQVSAGQMAAAMRMLPAQATDVVTQLAGGVNPFLVMLQQGGQVKDMFGGFKPMFAGLASAVGPVLLNPLALAAAAAVALGAGLAVVMNDSDRVEKSLALTGNAAGLTTGSFNSLAQGTRTASGATSGLSRDAAELAVSMGEFGPKTVGAVSAAMAGYAKATGKSISDIAGQFSNLSTDAGAWAVSMSRQMNFLTGATYAQIRALQEMGRNDEAAALAASSLTEALKGREPALSMLGKAVKALKDDWDRMWAAARGSLEAETVDERLKKAQERVDALRQRSQVPTNAPGYLDIGLAKVAQSQLPGAESDLARVKAAAEFDRIVASQDAARAQRNKDQTAAVDFINPMNKASSAQAVANLDLDVKRKWSAESQQIVRQYGVAIEAAAGDQAKVTALMNERNARLAEGGRRVSEELTSMANAQTAKARATASASIDLGLSGSTASEAATSRRLDAKQAAVDAALNQGLISERSAAQQSLAIELQRLAAKESLINAEIAAEQRRPIPAGDPAAAVQQQTKVAELRAQLAAVRDESKQAPILTGQKVAQLDLNGARQQAQEYAQIWQSAADFTGQLQSQTAQSMASLIRDPMERARAEAVISERQLRESAARLRLELGNRIAIARGQGNEGQAQELEAQMRRLETALTGGVSAINADLARKMEPAWLGMISGWRNTTALMRDEWDNTVGDITSKLQGGLANAFKGGKIDFKGMADSLLNGIANAQSKALVGSFNVEGVAARGKDAFGFNGPEKASAAFESLWQSIKNGTVIQDAMNLVTKTGEITKTSADAAATTSLGALASSAMSASIALGQISASAGAQSAGGGLGSIFGSLGRLFGGGGGAGASAGSGAGLELGGYPIDLTSVPGFSSGGHTGSGSRSSVAGVVHGQEYVFDADATSRIGRSNLDALRAGGSLGGGGNTSVSVNPQIAVSIQNAPAGDHQVKQSTGPDGSVMIDIIMAEVANQAANGGPVRDGIAAGFGIRPTYSRIG